LQGTQAGVEAVLAAKSSAGHHGFRKAAQPPRSEPKANEVNLLEIAEPFAARTASIPAAS